MNEMVYLIILGNEKSIATFKTNVLSFVNDTDWNIYFYICTYISYTFLN